MTALLAGCSGETNLEVEIGALDPALLQGVLSAPWVFSLDGANAESIDNSTEHQSYSRLAPGGCRGGARVYRVPEALGFGSSVVAIDLGLYAPYSSDGRTGGKGGLNTTLPKDVFGNFLDGAAITTREPPRLMYFLLGNADGDYSGLWMTMSDHLIEWVIPAMLSARNPWSLTAALTPGGHHVRLYLETGGQIETIVSKKDNFTDFYDSDVGDVEFFDLAGSRVHGLTLRDPNVTQNDAGVYALTWDNRPADIGPGHKYDSITVSPSFGLAFSVDGLDWTVYDAAMNIPPLPGHSSLPVRHVVPIFLTNDQIRLYFTTTTPALSSQPSSRQGCTSATAISN